MSLAVYVEIVVRAPDGQVQVNEAQLTMTINADVGNMHTEADLAKAAVQTLAAQTVERVEQKLIDWAPAAQAAIGG